jgi:hypothetical protein
VLRGKPNWPGGNSRQGAEMAHRFVWEGCPIFAQGENPEASAADGSAEVPKCVFTPATKHSECELRQPGNSWTYQRASGVTSRECWIFCAGQENGFKTSIRRHSQHPLVQGVEHGACARRKRSMICIKWLEATGPCAGCPGAGMVVVSAMLGES